MSQSYSIERAAICDIEDTVDFLLLEHSNAAPRFVEACYETFENLAVAPEMGRIYQP